MIAPSMRRTTARVTFAPMTPDTAFDITPDPELFDEFPFDELLLPLPSLLPRYALEQTPVVLPQALHHDSWSGMEILFIPVIKSFQASGD